MSKKSLKERLIASKKKREEILRRFGCIPYSILHLNRGAFTKNLFIYQRECPSRHIAHNPQFKKSEEMLRAEGYKHWKIPTGKKAGRGGTAMSIMPGELPDFFIKMYAKKGDTYLDPFMGQGVQMQVANIHGLNYIGYDTCKEFFDYIASVKERIQTRDNTIEIYHDDAKDMKQVADGSCDFCFTSPPYWDIEDYGDHPGDLAKNKSYEAFLDGMTEVAAEMYRKFKPGGTAVINVNDFRMDKKFYFYHSDTIQLFIKAGWEAV